jgi:hypothetical protein
MACFQHGEVEILKLFKMAMQSQQHVFVVDPSDQIPCQIAVEVQYSL